MKTIAAYIIVLLLALCISAGAEGVFQESITQCASLEELNDISGACFTRPASGNVTNESFSVIKVRNEEEGYFYSVVQYCFTTGGLDYILRSPGIVADVTGICPDDLSDYIIEGPDSFNTILYDKTEDYLLARWQDYNGTYCLFTHNSMFAELLFKPMAQELSRLTHETLLAQCDDAFATWYNEWYLNYKKVMNGEAADAEAASEAIEAYLNDMYFHSWIYFDYHSPSAGYFSEYGPGNAKLYYEYEDGLYRYTVTVENSDGTAYVWEMNAFGFPLSETASLICYADCSLQRRNADGSCEIVYTDSVGYFIKVYSFIFWTGAEDESCRLYRFEVEPPHTVIYYDANGNEYYPAIGSVEANDDIYRNIIAQYEKEGLDEEQLKKNIVANTATFWGGESISYVSVPYKEGHSGEWVLAGKKDGKIVAREGELPTRMPPEDVLVTVKYTANQYELTVVNPGDAEGESFTTGMLDYGTELNYDELGYTAPQAEEGEYLFYSTSETALDDSVLYNAKLPETMPATYDTYYACLVKGNWVEFYEEKDGEFVEYYPSIMSSLEYNMLLLTYYGYDTENYDMAAEYKEIVENIGKDIENEEEKEREKDYYRPFVQEGSYLYDAVDYVVPNVPEGKIGVWETEDGIELKDLEEMGTERVKLYATYYDAVTLTFTEVKPEDAAEDCELAADKTVTGKAGDEITEDMLPVFHGFEIDWIDAVPEVFPEADTVYFFRLISDDD